MSTKKNKSEYLKYLLDGTLLTKESVVRQIPFLLFWALLAIFYIANRYHAEKLTIEISRLQRQLNDLRSESISIEAELMFIGKQSNVIEMVKQKNLDLKESVLPPRKIVAPNFEKN